jgi:hypothetical protein
MNHGLTTRRPIIIPSDKLGCATAMLDAWALLRHNLIDSLGVALKSAMF